MEDKEVICNESHNCQTIDCIHRIPHIPTSLNCTPENGFFPCRDSSPVKNTLSACVRVKGGQYHTTTRITCVHCDGKGFHYDVKSHDILPTSEG